MYTIRLPSSIVSTPATTLESPALAVMSLNRLGRTGVRYYSTKQAEENRNRTRLGIAVMASPLHNDRSNNIVPSPPILLFVFASNIPERDKLPRRLPTKGCPLGVHECRPLRRLAIFSFFSFLLHPPWCLTPVPRERAWRVG